MEKEFIDALNINSKIGLSEPLSKLKYPSSRHVVTTHQLIGDPEFEIWLGKPDFMNVKFDLTLKGLNIEGDSTLHNAQITLYNGTDILAQSNMGVNFPFLHYFPIINSMTHWYSVTKKETLTKPCGI